MRIVGWVAVLAGVVVAEMLLWSTAGAMITSSSTVGVLLGLLLMVAGLLGVFFAGRAVWRAVSSNL